MIQTLMAGVAVLTEAAEGGYELPMSALAFGITAGVIFAFMLGTVFAFRNLANRHDPEAYQQGHGHGPSHDSNAGQSGRSGPPSTGIRH